ncbi:MAG: hypothetical protein AAF602_22860 [Myxococcota bacterium]
MTLAIRSLALFALLGACSSEPDLSDPAAEDTAGADQPSLLDEPDQPNEPDPGRPPVDLTRGARGMFAGQSFFVPVARSFDALANGGDFPNHSIRTVFAGGPSGSPQALWENPTRRAEIEEVLAAGDVDLFGLTIGEVDPDNPGEFYARWIDLALGYNPQTRIFVGFPYLQFGPDKETDAFAQEIVDGGEAMFSLVEGLRGVYPDTEILYVNYGPVLSEMKEDFEAGELADLEGLAAPPGTQDTSPYLFADGGVGHAGPMAEHICALVWLNLLYGAEIGPYVDPAYDAEDIERIAAEVIASNQPFRVDAE